MQQFDILEYLLVTEGIALYNHHIHFTFTECLMLISKKTDI